MAASNFELVVETPPPADSPQPVLVREVVVTPMGTVAIDTIGRLWKVDVGNCTMKRITEWTPVEVSTEALANQ